VPESITPQDQDVTIYAPASSADLLREALDNMPHGVVMFDANSCLVVCNRRYIEMYGLSPEIVLPGCTLFTLIEQREKTGLLAGNVEEYRTGILDIVRRGQISSQYVETTDGRTIHVVNQPIPSGGWVATHEDVTQHKAAEARIEHLAHHDALTDLPNRILFRAQLEQALQMAAQDRQVAVLFIDLDDFKAINDTLGHPVGDELLQLVAARLRSCIRDTDMVARLGGDEFVVIQTSVRQPSDAADLATRIREALAEPFDVPDHRIVTDASIGIALAPHDGSTADQLLKNADLALYGAKSGGRGAYRFFEHAMDARMRERRELEMELRRASSLGEFELHYQPIVNVKLGTISACEALLRWRHPSNGVVSPASFISVAEEIGLITQIGEWVLCTACEEAMRWPDEVTLAVNVSPAQFRKQDLVEVVDRALAASGLPARRLEIEITETVLLDYTEETLAVLHQLRERGVRIAMDDFGTGFSSLSYLQKFPFDKLKIDQSFIMNLSERKASSAILRAIVGLAENFGMTTTAEGVETTQQREIVATLGCTEIQGYLFSAPRPPEEILQLLSREAPERAHGTEATMP
jgi:diguanylate cyclase (GGDEF)-like protein/PAS domain S-box-containing protein